MADIGDSHLDEATLARLLADASEDWLRFLLHELARCEPCQDVGGYILDLYKAGALKIPFGVGDLALAKSRMEAPRLWADLKDAPPHGIHRRVQTEARRLAYYSYLHC